jgi:hypothetical protein
MNLKVVEKSGRGLIWETHLQFAYRDWERQEKLVRIASLMVEVWAQDVSTAE